VQTLRQGPGVEPHELLERAETRRRTGSNTGTISRSQARERELNARHPPSPRSGWGSFVARSNP